jgi:hypothetical protein
LRRPRCQPARCANPPFRHHALPRPCNFSPPSAVFLVNAHTSATDDSRALADAMVMKLHRILALALVWVGMLVAGTPAMACCVQATPTHDCCSNRSCPSRSRSDEIAPHCGLQDCCAAGAPSAVALVSHITSNKTDIQPARADPPLAITFLPALSPIASSARSGVAAAASPIFPALSPLYLSTRRLRL